MNRRKFVALGAAGIASLHSLTSAGAQSSLILESRLTDAVVDFSATGYEFVDHKMTTSTDGGSTERIEVRSDLSTLIIQFTSWVPRVTPEEVHDLALDYLYEEYGEDAIEDLGLHDVGDGSWLAFRTDSSRAGVELWYTEFQLGAFPDIDLMIEFVVQEANLDAAFEEAQSVTIADMPPFLFVEESQVTAGLFVVENRQTTQSTGSRQQRSNSGSGTTQSTATLSDDEVIQTVRDHQTQYHEELDRLYEAVEILAAGEAVGAEEAELFTELMDIMLSWSSYPDAAAEFTFSADLASLESAYIEWADGIGAMGETMGKWLLGTGDIDAFIESIEVTSSLDARLSAELRTLGAGPVEYRADVGTRLRESLSFVGVTSLVR